MSEDSFDADAIAVHLASPLNADHYIFLKTLAQKEIQIKDFQQKQLEALIDFAQATADDVAVEMVLEIFLKCDVHRLAMFDEILVPFLLKLLDHSRPSIRLHAVTNLSLLIETSNFLLEILLRDSGAVALLVGLLNDDSLGYRIQQQTLYLLADVTKKSELHKLLTFHDIVNSLLALLSPRSHDDEVSFDTVSATVQILSQLLSEQQALEDFLQSEAFHIFFDLLRDDIFLKFPARITHKYFAIVKALFESHQEAFTEVLRKGEHLDSFIALLVQSFDHPFITQNVVKCMDAIMTSESRIAMALCEHKNLEDLMKIAISRESQVAISMLLLFCKALQMGTRYQNCFCAHASVRLLAVDIIEQVENEVYHSSSVQLFSNMLAGNPTLKSKLAATSVQSNHERPLLVWLINQLCTYKQNVVPTSKNVDKLGCDDVFHLWLYRFLLEWLDGSSVAINHAINVSSIISATCSFFSSPTDSSHGFASLWNGTLGILLICALYNTTHEDKWIAIIREDMKLSAVYSCCDRCLRDPRWAQNVAKNSFMEASSFPIDERFCMKMCATFEYFMNWIVTDIACLNNPLVLSPTTVSDYASVKQRVTAMKGPSLPSENSRSIEYFVKGDIDGDDCKNLSEPVDLSKDMESRADLNSRIQQLNLQLKQQKEIIAKHDKDLQELRNLVDAMNTFHFE